MTLAEVSIRRPVLAVVLSILIVLFGLVSLAFLGIREYPAVDPPIVTVTTSYPGASPDVIDTQITEPLEQNINGVAGIRTMSSTSRDGQSQIRVEFDLSVDVEAAANDVRDKVSIARRLLPVDVDPPIVEKADADASPIVFMTLSSETKGILDVAYIADSLVKERVQTIPGVASVRIFGDRRYAMRLVLDANRMAAHQVTPSDVQGALARENVDLPSGRLEGQSMEVGLKTQARLTTPAEFNRMLIKQQDGRQIVLEDIGRAELSAENLRGGMKTEGLPLVGVAIIPQPNTNAIAIADEFYRRLEQIKKELPPEYTTDIGYDFTTFVRRSIEEVEETLLIAFGLVALIIYLFLRDWRATVIPVVAIPVSIISAFFIMYVLGFSINILTLVGLVLAIGLVCDDAIVVLENIYGKIEQGIPPLRAAIEGSKEIYFAVISTTITLAAVFLPIVFLQGLTGRLFREFGLVVAGSVLVSAFVALSLSPMMCRFLLKRHEKPSFFYRITEPFFQGMTRGYAAALGAFMRVRWVALAAMVGILAFTVIWVGKLPSELAPLEDRSNIRVNVRAPEGATFEYTEAALDTIGVYVSDNLPEVRRSFSIVGNQGGPPNTGTQNLYLFEPFERTRTQAEIFQQITKDLGSFGALRVFPAQPPTIGSRAAGQPLQYVIRAPSLAALVEVLPGVLDEAQRRPELRFVDADLKVNRPEASIRVDRARAAELGVPVLDVARALQLAFGDQRFGYFIMNGKQYQVIGQLDRDDRNEPEDLRRLFVRGASGQMISLDSLVTWEEQAAPAAIYRFDRFVSATISGSPATGYTLGDGIRAMDEVTEKALPQNFSTSLAGEAREFADSSSSLIFAFGVALLLIYLVLAAQFESFIDPFIILLSVPMSLSGAVAALALTGSSLNIFSQIGVIMLIGLVTKNGILIVEFANQRKEQGLTVRAAAVEAAVSRFRPILMTSLATILGVAPIALSLGAASGSRQSLGIAVMGGLLVGTLLTLFLLPALYSFISREHRPGEAEDAHAPTPAAPSESPAHP
ncbi:efflux RND transporter permease subunit [Chondromyces apiculatus]|uniref:RND multidrug efflux transporter/Acriflavin resistance protein n=1 Tax=Chondromyces apiculatus DSM 436 TaxID=1192034 RepID=A0A017TDH9_9BACT|nr:efflux RND transporter permease subunit [Chondromyces apiculatus]EYF06870.1 RND multidrug efflux transporter/Acriflavin resistance protein [Chondromyces apiculatus DSM 436]